MKETKDLNKMQHKKPRSKHPSMADKLEQDQWPWEQWQECIANGCKDKYKVIKDVYKELSETVPSTGIIYKWLHKYHPDACRTQQSYGTGKQVKVGRSSKNKFVSRKGEVFVRTKNGWDREYRTIVAPTILQKQQYDMVVHHRDGNHNNNNPDNLEVMTRAQHTSLHVRAYHARKKLLKQCCDKLDNILKEIDMCLKDIQYDTKK
jgi:hypothetical protein